MDGTYSRGESDLYVSRSRSLRIGHAVTSVRLENVFWDVLAEIAAASGLRTSQLIQSLCANAARDRGGVPNLASLLRVTCVRYACSKSGGAAVVALAGLEDAALQTHAERSLKSQKAAPAAPAGQ